MDAIMTEEFVIQSDIAVLPSVEERIFHFCHECNVGDYHATVSVAALQAVENAIVHGNRSDVSRTVTVTCGTCRGGIYVEVADEGEGFDFGRYGDLPMGESDAGEGIFVMKSLADQMTFSEGGRRVRLEFIVSGIDPAEALERIALLQEHFSPVAA